MNLPFIFILAIIIFCFGFGISQEHFKQKAVNAGHALWIKTNELTKWKWKWKTGGSELRMSYYNYDLDIFETNICSQIYFTTADDIFSLSFIDLDSSQTRKIIVQKPNISIANNKKGIIMTVEGHVLSKNKVYKLTKIVIEN